MPAVSIYYLVYCPSAARTYRVCESGRCTGVAGVRDHAHAVYCSDGLPFMQGLNLQDV